MKPVAQPGGQIVQLMGPVNLNRLASGVEDHLAGTAVAQMLLQIGARFGGQRVVDQIIEKGEKLFAVHFSIPISRCPFFLPK